MRIITMELTKLNKAHHHDKTLYLHTYIQKRGKKLLLLHPNLHTHTRTHTYTNSTNKQIYFTKQKIFSPGGFFVVVCDDVNRMKYIFLFFWYIFT